MPFAGNARPARLPPREASPPGESGLPRTKSRMPGMLDPVLGSTLVEDQLRKLGSSIHVYGHIHVNRQVTIDGVSYVNNAFGYPHEMCNTAKRLKCIYER